MVRIFLFARGKIFAFWHRTSSPDEALHLRGGAIVHHRVLGRMEA
jgi:hypothetical protein